jgi:hypothetical protein
MDAAILREWATDAIRYWERQRIVYNFILAAVVISCFVLTLPTSKHVFSVNLLLLLFVLAVLANVAYCATYAVDIFAQTSGFRELWQNYRWILFTVGVTFAAVITRFWSLAMFSAGSR